MAIFTADAVEPQREQGRAAFAHRSNAVWAQGTRRARGHDPWVSAMDASLKNIEGRPDRPLPRAPAEFDWRCWIALRSHPQAERAMPRPAVHADFRLLCDLQRVVYLGADVPDRGQAWTDPAAAERLAGFSCDSRSRSPWSAASGACRRRPNATTVNIPGAACRPASSIRCARRYKRPYRAGARACQPRSTCVRLAEGVLLRQVGLTSRYGKALQTFASCPRAWCVPTRTGSAASLANTPGPIQSAKERPPCGLAKRGFNHVAISARTLLSDGLCWLGVDVPVAAAPCQPR